MAHLIPVSPTEVYPAVTVMETIEALLEKAYGKPIARNQSVSEEVVQGIRQITVTVPDSPYWDRIRLIPAADMVLTALANGDLRGIIKIEGEGQFYRLPRTYWVGLDYQADNEAFASIPTAIRSTAIDPAIAGSVIILAEKAVTAWLAGTALPPDIIAPSNPPVAKPRSRKGGGRPKPDWYQNQDAIMRDHSNRINAAMDGGRQAPGWPTANTLLRKLLERYSGATPPTYSAVTKHVKKIKKELLG